MLFEPREPINPRAFAVRHVLLEEIQRRQEAVPAGRARDRLAALARAIDVGYTVETRCYAVRAAGTTALEVPLAAFRFYQQREDASPDSAALRDVILDANRDQARRIIDALVAAADA